MTVAAHRIGHPTPLVFHLGAAVAAYQQAILAAPLAATEKFPWHPDGARYAGPAPDQIDVALEAAERLTAMLDGIAKWQRHPWRRRTEDPPALWTDGSTRLLDYGQTTSATDPDGPPVVVVPSLINRSYVLDLLPGRSFVAALAEAGFRPLLVDWGAPGREEQGFDLDAYLALRLAPALGEVRRITGRNPAMIGYCMGGTLAAGYALGDPMLKALVTIGAPWDFSGGNGLAFQIRAAARGLGAARLRPMLRSLTDAFGFVPFTLFQQLFALVDPIQASRKFRRFASMPQDGDAAALFVAMEDWLADGVAMAGPAAETLLVDWQVENATHRGAWPLAARAGTARVRCPALVVAGRSDSIAPPAMADPLLGLMRDGRLLTPPLGHVGMITGTAAPREVWAPVVEFLRGVA